jgi:carboxypeptidase C (cathepsin A)
MNGFYVQHPEMHANEFQVTGQSYTGKYIPNIALAILESNDRGESDIPLASVLIGDGLIDLVLQRTTI